MRSRRACDGASDTRTIDLSIELHMQFTHPHLIADVRERTRNVSTRREMSTDAGHSISSRWPRRRSTHELGPSGLLSSLLHAHR
jgi:hypothetical protein